MDPSQPAKHQKRGLDVTDGGANAAVDGFFRDMKKRKYAPAYDARTCPSPTLVIKAAS